MTFDPAGPYTLEWAIECARNGHPQSLLWMIEEKMGAEVAAVLFDLLHHPKKLVKVYRAKFTPNQARAIRERFEQVRNAHPKARVVDIQREFETTFKISHDSLLDILYQKNTYATKEKVRTSKRKHYDKRKK